MFRFLQELDNFVVSNDWVFVPLAVVFIAVALIAILEIVYQGACAFVLPYISSHDLKRYGEWAVVTGATDGIGKAYCRCLAERGINIVIISRDQERLQKTSEELISEYGVKVATIKADFRKGWELYEELSILLKNKEIGILVNNVGKAMDISRSFHCYKSDVIVDLVTVNIQSFLIMTKIVLPEMLRRKRGAIVAMSSLSGQINTPIIATYGASKSALTSLSRALFYEYQTSGVEFQCLIPSCVTTKIGLIKNNEGLSKWVFPDPYSYSRSAFRTLGFTSYTSGYFLHSIQWLLIDRKVNTMFMFLFKKFVMKYQPRRE